ncbi:hypothetical protein HAX54_016592 [Datura stramonium]|uniref:Uncharacterized protein n=1 Tax=Datura stramonium TaxID=4076 RepID=A0ABS8Y2Z1_DATST|nr:hypothetical protein [Datura stramonium]
MLSTTNIHEFHTFYPSLQLLTSVFSFLCSLLSSRCCQNSPDGEDTTITGIQSNLRYKTGPYLADKDVRVRYRVVLRRALIEFGVVDGDGTTPYFGVGGGGGGYSPNVGGEFDGVDGAGGGEGFSPINEEVRCPPETPFTRGESSNVGDGTSEEPSYFCKCLKCTEKIDSLILKMQSLEDTVKILISKRGVKPSSSSYICT